MDVSIDRASQEMAFPFRVANCKTFRIRDKISETVLEESPFSFNPPETRKKLHCVSINSCVISRNCLLPNTGSIFSFDSMPVTVLMSLESMAGRLFYYFQCADMHTPTLSSR